MLNLITKTDAAERQLNTAIRLFFENRDHLSSYALAVASREITDDVIKSQYNELYQRELARLGDPLKVRLSYRDELKLHVKDEFHKDFFNLDRKLQNFLKHADKDPTNQIEPVTTKHLALIIIFAIRNFILMTEKWTVEMACFLAWFAVAEPKLVKSNPEKESINTKMSEICTSILKISLDPYNRNTLEAIYLAMSNVSR